MRNKYLQNYLKKSKLICETKNTRIVESCKITPLHKKVTKDEISNYRPSSDLCTTSKIYEKLILEQLLDLAKRSGIYLKGTNQHGFKKERNTRTA
jgi:hypothetical protein